MFVAFGEVREPAGTQDPVTVGGSLSQDPHRCGEELLCIADAVACPAFWRKLQAFQRCAALHHPLKVGQAQRASPVCIHERTFTRTDTLKDDGEMMFVGTKPK